MIGSILNVALVTVAGFPGIVNGLDRMIMMADDIILPKEDIQLIHFGFPMILMRANIHIIENDIEVISPVVQFWHMGLLKRVIDCQIVKAKGFQDREAGLRGFTCKIDPKKSASIAYEFWEFLRGNIFTDRLSRKIV